ncbi:MAG: hypothetical protein EI684_12795 [Candidatus Viridilinea halotolerans]|uniref:Uncharacterized protein n=1 Tax=Candidatus Viridilinea halotolerans TaxID=2491704 RepID=A0A426TY20_9CHLR|nr:MAG: hypothetical protein EI684_12795 [Candidatus Viridilinea halotolerans]
MQLPKFLRSAMPLMLVWLLLGLIGLEGATSSPYHTVAHAAQPNQQALGLVYSSAGRHYMVDLAQQRSVPIGPAPPRGSVRGSGASLFSIKLSDTHQAERPFFTIVQTDAESRQITELGGHDSFYAQFPEILHLYTYTHAEMPLAPLVLSSDGRHVLFTACYPGMGESAICDPFQFDLITQTFSRLEGMRFYDTRTWLNPDGERALDAWKLACSGQFVRTNQEAVLLSGMPTSVAWLDDQRFVYSRYVCESIFTGPTPGFEPSYDLVLAATDGSDERVLVSGMLARELTLAPDQEQLAFITSDPGMLGRDSDALWVVNFDGSNLRRIMDVPEDATDLRWDMPVPPTMQRDVTAPTLPTFGAIAYLHEGNISLLDLATGQSTPLVNDGSVGSPGMYGGAQVAWSPDGQQLAYASNRAGDYDIYLLDLATETETPISTDPQDEFLPTFAPDGTLLFVRILAVEEGSGVTWSLIRYTPDGELSADAPQATREPIRLDALDSESAALVSYSRVFGYLDSGAPELVWDHDYYACPSPGGVGQVFDAQWSHDKRRLAVLAADCWPTDTSWRWQWNNAIFLVDPSDPSAPPQRLPLNHGWLTALAWAPDGAWLVVAQDAEVVHTGPGMRPEGLWLINLEAGEGQQISPIGQRPAWRPLTPEQAMALEATPNVQPTDILSPTVEREAAGGSLASDTSQNTTAQLGDQFALAAAIFVFVIVMGSGIGVGLLIWLLVGRRK